MNCSRFALVFLLIACGDAFCQTNDSEDASKIDKKKVENIKEVKLIDITLADGAIELKLPETWKQTPPQSRIIEREFAVPAAEGDKREGRLTMMRSGGSVTQNIERWYGQFTQPDKRPTKDTAKMEKKEINGQEVVIVDISGTFKDSQGGGPFAPGKIIEREDYRMLGGIVQTKQRGQYFFKLYGPKNTIESAAKSFAKMMDSITSK